MFQSTHPHGVRRKLKPFADYAKVFQSTHPHGVRRNATIKASGGLVSIHAPTWGATASLDSGTGGAKFQSTHPHGVRLINKLKIINTLTFQSTHPHGVRRTKNNAIKRSTSFNPRTHMGCDLSFLMSEILRPQFQSTHPHGVRHSSLNTYISNIEVSIHAPTWGATIFWHI